MKNALPIPSIARAAISTQTLAAESTEQTETKEAQPEDAEATPAERIRRASAEHQKSRISQ